MFHTIPKLLEIYVKLLRMLTLPSLAGFCEVLNIFLYYYPEYELNFGIDHSRIVDLLQVFDTSGTIDVLITVNQWLSLKVAAMIDPDCPLDRGF